VVSRVFLSHSSRDSRQAIAVKAWLIGQEPGLAEEIFLDLDPHTGIRPGERWKQALNQANTRCEAVICLLSQHWESSHECKTEYRHAEDMHKAIVCARLEPLEGSEITSEWQRCDLFRDHGPFTDVDIGDGGEPVVLRSEGLQRLLDGLRALGIERSPAGWRAVDPRVLVCQWGTSRFIARLLTKRGGYSSCVVRRVRTSRPRIRRAGRLPIESIARDGGGLPGRAIRWRG